MYDDFLKKTHPKKYIKFANFCPKCTLFRNPQQVREQRVSGENAKEMVLPLRASCRAAKTALWAVQCSRHIERENSKVVLPY